MKRKFTISIIIVILLLSVFVVTTRYGVYTGKAILMQNSFYTDPIYFNSMSGYYYNEPDDFAYQIFRTDNVFPSENYEDYEGCNLKFYFNSISVLPYYLVDYDISYHGEEEPQIIFVISLLLFGYPEITPFKQNQLTSCMFMYIYTDGMTDDELIEHLGDYEITLYLKNIFFNNIKITKKLSEVNMEFVYE